MSILYIHYIHLYSPKQLVFTVKEPWNLKESPSELNVVLYESIESLRVAGILLQPIVPELSNRLLDGIGIPKEERSLGFAKYNLDGVTRQDMQLHIFDGKLVLHPKLEKEDMKC